MAQFSYQAKSRDGKTVSGTVDAADRRGALAAVSRLGLLPLRVESGSGGASAKPAKGGARAASGAKGGGGLSLSFSKPVGMDPRERLLFTGELADLLDGGMTLGDALNALARRGGGEGGPAAVVAALRDDIVRPST